MLLRKKNTLINIFAFFIKKKFFIGFFISLFFIIFCFFVLNDRLLLLNDYKYFFLFLTILQIFFYFKYFIDISFSQKNFFIILSLIFTGIIISIISIGSLWIFDHLNH
ncbi:Cytochrome bo(3) ubiquinol oxidase subunit 4 [Buchnera aphidicola (Cinara piceae)]|uniref:Cytochrome bo(3) ubiquinol oxidase subunit 4 n=1 Tax=Buchnera aphidicola (Cinara piceae) TaxID=1660043 RepID=A0A803GD68_9GAMM|nr:cytochrome o ubiquinol oxidase subunit IV [Buchnera aphidicola]VFP88601.1 Cytochrome bo(3) ubiquinol oxidase subunit 4 [Buchnera aphidicola (Cinara piceae)]